jgi:hypothetical protein
VRAVIASGLRTFAMRRGARPGRAECGPVRGRSRRARTPTTHPTPRRARARRARAHDTWRGPDICRRSPWRGPLDLRGPGRVRPPGGITTATPEPAPVEDDQQRPIGLSRPGPSGSPTNASRAACKRRSSTSDAVTVAGRSSRHRGASGSGTSAAARAGCPVHARRSSSSRGTGTRCGGSGEARVVRPYVRGVSQIVSPRSRLYRWRMLPLVDVRWSGQVLEMRYVPSGSTLHTLDALLAAERAECPWLVWELQYDRGWPVVRIQADPQDSPALAAIAFVATGGQGRYAPRRPAERTSWSAVESPGERDGGRAGRVGARGWPPQNVAGFLLRTGADPVLGEGDACRSAGRTRADDVEMAWSGDQRGGRGIPGAGCR